MNCHLKKISFLIDVLIHEFAKLAKQHPESTEKISSSERKQVWVHNSVRELTKDQPEIKEISLLFLYVGILVITRNMLTRVLHKLT